MLCMRCESKKRPHNTSNLLVTFSMKTVINSFLGASGGMVDALDLGSSTARCGGSSPLSPTNVSLV